MNYFLLKTDPQTYSLEDLKKDKTTVWDGVHNFQAINFIKTMKLGDTLFIYHSQGDASIVGLAKVISEPRPDKGPRTSWVVDIEYIKTFDNPITLKEIKQSDKFNDWLLVRNGRLSTMSVPEKFVTWLQEKNITLS